MEAKWLSSMDTRQREAWGSLKPQYQNKHFVAGEMTLAFHKTHHQLNLWMRPHL